MQKLTRFLTILDLKHLLILWGNIAQVYGREQASRAWVTRESMEEDDMVMR